MSTTKFIGSDNLVDGSQRFVCVCYQRTDGRYLSLKEMAMAEFEISRRSIAEVYEYLSECQPVDSSLPIEDRWGVYPID